MNYKATIEEENKEIAKRYKNLLKETYQTLSRSDKLMIRKAFNLSVEAHSNQRRKTALQRSGVKVVVEQCDMGDELQVATMLNRIRSQNGPLRVVVHAAGVLADKAFVQQDYESMKLMFSATQSLESQTLGSQILGSQNQGSQKLGSQ